MKTIIKVLLATMLISFVSTSAFGQQALYKSLNKRMSILYKNGKTKQAIETAKEIVKVAEETFGKNHAYYTASLENLALLHVAEGNNAKAASLYEEAFTVREGLLGKNNPKLKSVLEKLEECYKTMRANDKLESTKARIASLQI